MRGVRWRAAILALVLAPMLLVGCSAAAQQDSQEQQDPDALAPAAVEPVDTDTNTEPASIDAITCEVNGTTLHIALADTDAARALADRLAEGPITLTLSAYGGFEKVGPLGFSLPMSDEQVDAQPGDVMLYQGNQITIFTGANSWSYTRLGHVEGMEADELAALLGDGDVTVTLGI